MNWPVPYGSISDASPLLVFHFRTTTGWRFAPETDRSMVIRKRLENSFPQELANLVPELFRETRCEDWVVKRHPLLRRDCTVYFLRSRQYRLPDLVLKIFRKDAVSKELVTGLHTASERLHRSATDQWAIPEPIFCAPDEYAVAMEYINAPISGNLLRRGLHSNGLRQSIISNAARWLSWYHGQSTITVEPFDADIPVINILKTAAKIRQLNPPRLSRDRFLNACIEFSQKIAATSDGTLLLHATGHGDFTPFNLFAQNQKTVGIDYQVQRRMPVTHDICRYLLYLEVSKFIPTPISQLRSHGGQARDFNIFMKAYGENARMPEPEFWLRLQFLEITRRLTSLALPRASTWKQPLRAMERMILRRNAKHILERLG